ncbi:hypothetical protein PQR15_00035 [Streptomyces lydicus]|nr:hypothetical protein [Streptomyces lydicus]
MGSYILPDDGLRPPRRCAAGWPGYRQRLIRGISGHRPGGPAGDEFAATTMEHSGGWRAAAVLDEDGRRITGTGSSSA